MTKAKIKSAVEEVMRQLSDLDEGKDVALSFVSSRAICEFCETIGLKKSWAGRTIDEIAPLDKLMNVNVTPEEDANAILSLIMEMIEDNMFKSRGDEKFDKTIVNDYIKKSTKGFMGEPTFGHIWEFQYALAVELEHGRTQGTNVTNNHPLLTGLIVMAHLTEDKLYYARLMCMELEGELTNLIMDDKPNKDIAEAAKHLEHAKLYLGKRRSEKLKKDFPLPI